MRHGLTAVLKFQTNMRHTGKEDASEHPLEVLHDIYRLVGEGVLVRNEQHDDRPEGLEDGLRVLSVLKRAEVVLMREGKIP